MSNHVHDMRPIRKGYGYSHTVQKCTSCEFRCTTSALPAVRRSPGLHRIVKAGSPQAKVVWNG